MSLFSEIIFYLKEARKIKKIDAMFYLLGGRRSVVQGSFGLG